MTKHKKVKPKKPADPVFSDHVSFQSLISPHHNWGYEYKGKGEKAVIEAKKNAEQARKNPNNFSLQMGALLHIINLLESIDRKLKREKVIR